MCSLIFNYLRWHLTWGRSWPRWCSSHWRSWHLWRWWRWTGSRCSHHSFGSTGSIWWHTDPYSSLREGHMNRERERERGGFLFDEWFVFVLFWTSHIDQAAFHHTKEERWTKRESLCVRETGSHQMSCDSWPRAALLLPSLIRPAHTASLSVCVWLAWHYFHYTRCHQVNL